MSAACHKGCRDALKDPESVYMDAEVPGRAR